MFTIKGVPGYFYVSYDNVIEESKIAKILNMNRTDYIKMIMKYGARLSKGGYKYYFSTREQGESLLVSQEFRELIVVD